MAVKPTVMPISPNDARSAIRVQKQLESDIVRLREDIKRRTCNIPAAKHAIAIKERQMTQIQAFLRQHHVDLNQFDRLEEERRRQAMRRQHAIFEDQRRATVPGKHSPQAKKARLDKAVDNIRPPVLPAPISPVFHPAQAAKQRRANEEAMQRARQMQAQKEEKLRLQADQIRRGQQAQREEISRLKAKAEERQENFRKLQSETKNIVSNEAARLQKAAEERRDAQLKAAHEKKMAEENARRAAAAKAKEQERIAREKAEKLAREKALAEANAKRAAEEKRARTEMLRNKNQIKRNFRQVSQRIKEMEMLLSQITMEMSHAKMSNPEVMDDMREHRARITEELTNLKRQRGPLEAELRRIEKQMQTTFMADNNAGLRAWHKNLFSAPSKRKLSVSLDFLSKEYRFDMLSPHSLETIRNMIADYENGSKYANEEEFAVVFESYVMNEINEIMQKQHRAAALSGTPRHVKHGMSAVAQNNYNRLRTIQQAEDSIKQDSQRAEAAATAQGETLAGLFPKLRSSVTRMVGN